MQNLRQRILEQLVSHLEGMDADDLRPAPPEMPEAVAVEVSPMDVEPKDPLMEKADEGGSDKGPMDELLADADEGQESEEAPEGDEDDHEELSDEELEEMLRES